MNERTFLLRAAGSDSRGLSVLFMGLLILAITACQAPTIVPTPYYTPLPPAIKTRIAETEAVVTATHRPPPTPTATATIEWLPTPSYDIAAQLLLDECFPDEGEGTPIPPIFKPCSDFSYSQDGRYLAYAIDPDYCGRNLVILNLNTGVPIFRTDTFGVHKFEFIPSGKLLLGKGHCEGGGVSLFDPDSGEYEHLGGEAPYLWNPQQSAFAVNPPHYHSIVESVWGYSISEAFLFLPEQDNWQIDNHLLWTTDGSHLLYQHRDMIRDEETWIDSFPTGRKIIRVDATTGETKILAADPMYDYHLCEGVHSTCDRWHGDWIQVRKYPYQSQELEYTGGFTPIEKCLLYGIECEGEPTLFALNWRTGEMIPWDDRILPTPIPSSTPDGQQG